MTQEPARWLDRLVGACFSVLLGALALYGAVWLIESIWRTLIVVVFLASCVAGAIVLWRAHHDGRW